MLQAVTSIVDVRTGTLFLLDETFEGSMSHLDLDGIEGSDDPVFITDDSLIIRGANSAYVKFGEENGLVDVAQVAGLGTAVLEAMTEPARRFYEDAFGQVLSGKGLFQQEYECSSPAAMRRFQLNCYAFPDASGLVFSHHLITESMHDAEVFLLAPRHVSPEGFIVQCSHCRKIRNWDSDSSWEWVPSVLRHRPGGVSNAFCDLCLDHYPGMDDAALAHNSD